MRRTGTHNNRFQVARCARRTAASLRSASAAEAGRWAGLRPSSNQREGVWRQAES